MTLRLKPIWFVARRTRLAADEEHADRGQADGGRGNPVGAGTPGARELDAIERKGIGR
jgi:hypothetical protein